MKVGNKAEPKKGQGLAPAALSRQHEAIPGVLNSIHSGTGKAKDSPHPIRRTTHCKIALASQPSMHYI
jgi:hypothetical protein